MKTCPRMVDVGRRKFLTGAGIAAAGAAAAAVVPHKAEASPQLARLSYPSNRLANVSDLKPNEPLQVAYPDADAPGVLLKLGNESSRRGRDLTATSSALRRSARTRDFRSLTIPRTRR